MIKVGIGFLIIVYLVCLANANYGHETQGLSGLPTSVVSTNSNSHGEWIEYGNKTYLLQISSWSGILGGALSVNNEHFISVDVKDIRGAFVPPLFISDVDYKIVCPDAPSVVYRRIPTTSGSFFDSFRFFLTANAEDYNKMCTFTANIHVSDPFLLLPQPRPIILLYNFQIVQFTRDEPLEMRLAWPIQRVIGGHKTRRIHVYLVNHDLLPLITNTFGYTVRLDITDSVTGAILKRARHYGTGLPVEYVFEEARGADNDITLYFPPARPLLYTFTLFRAPSPHPDDNYPAPFVKPLVVSVQHEVPVFSRLGLSLLYKGAYQVDVALGTTRWFSLQLVDQDDDGDTTFPGRPLSGTVDVKVECSRPTSGDEIIIQVTGSGKSYTNVDHIETTVNITGPPSVVGTPCVYTATLTRPTSEQLPPLQVPFTLQESLRDEPHRVVVVSSEPLTITRGRPFSLSAMLVDNQDWPLGTMGFEVNVTAHDAITGELLPLIVPLPDPYTYTNYRTFRQLPHRGLSVAAASFIDLLFPIPSPTSSSPHPSSVIFKLNPRVERVGYMPAYTFPPPHRRILGPYQIREPTFSLVLSSLPNQLKLGKDVLFQVILHNDQGQRAIFDNITSSSNNIAIGLGTACQGLSPGDPIPIQIMTGEHKLIYASTTVKIHISSDIRYTNKQCSLTMTTPSLPSVPPVTHSLTLRDTLDTDPFNLALSSLPLPPSITLGTPFNIDIVILSRLGTPVIGLSGVQLNLTIYDTSSKQALPLLIPSSSSSHQPSPTTHLITPVTIASGIAHFKNISIIGLPSPSPSVTIYVSIITSPHDPIEIINMPSRDLTLGPINLVEPTYTLTASSPIPASKRLRMGVYTPYTHTFGISLEDGLGNKITSLALSNASLSVNITCQSPKQLNVTYTGSLTLLRGTTTIHIGLQGTPFEEGVSCSFTTTIPSRSSIPPLTLPFLPYITMEGEPRSMTFSSPPHRLFTGIPITIGVNLVDVFGQPASHSPSSPSIQVILSAIDKDTQQSVSFHSGTLVRSFSSSSGTGSLVHFDSLVMAGGNRSIVFMVNVTANSLSPLSLYNLILPLISQPIQLTDSSHKLIILNPPYSETINTAISIVIQVFNASNIIHTLGAVYPVTISIASANSNQTSVSIISQTQPTNQGIVNFTSISLTQGLIDPGYYLLTASAQGLRPATSYFTVFASPSEKEEANQRALNETMVIGLTFAGVPSTVLNNPTLLHQLHQRVGLSLCDGVKDIDPSFNCSRIVPLRITFMTNTLSMVTPTYGPSTVSLLQTYITTITDSLNLMPMTLSQQPIFHFTLLPSTTNHSSSVSSSTPTPRVAERVRVLAMDPTSTLYANGEVAYAGTNAFIVNPTYDDQQGKGTHDDDDDDIIPIAVGAAVGGGIGVIIIIVVLIYGIRRYQERKRKDVPSTYAYPNQETEGKVTIDHRSSTTGSELAVVASEMP